MTAVCGRDGGPGIARDRHGDTRIVGQQGARTSSLPFAIVLGQGPCSLLFYCALLLTGPDSVQAQAYEGFDYPIGSNLAGANGGSGFSGTWRVTSGGPTNAVAGAASGVIVEGLTYTDAQGQTLPVTGGAWQTSSSFVFGQGQRNTVENFGAAGTRVWMSFLVRQLSAAGGLNYAQGTPGTGFGFGSGAMSAGPFGIPTAGYTAFYDGGGASVNIGNAVNKVTLVVISVDFASAGNDTLRVWFDPILNQPLDAPALVGAIDNYPSAINGATLAWGDSRSFVFDELRVGASIGWVDQIVFRDGFE